MRAQPYEGGGERLAGRGGTCARSRFARRLYFVNAVCEADQSCS